MELLVVGLLLFFMVHLIPGMASLRGSLVRMLGENGYKAIFSLLSLAGLALVVIGKGDADYIELYEPPAWAMHLTGLLMLLAIACIVSFLLNTAVRNITDHPMLWGIVFWSTGHLIANGDQASLLLFGSFLIYSIFVMVTAAKPAERGGRERATLMQNGIGLVVTSLAYMALMMGHAWFTGISLMA